MIFKKISKVNSRTPHSGCCFIPLENATAQFSLSSCKSHNYQGNFAMLFYFHLSSGAHRRIFYLQSRGLNAAFLVAPQHFILHAAPHKLSIQSLKATGTPMQEPRARPRKKKMGLEIFWGFTVSCQTYKDYEQKLDLRNQHRTETSQPDQLQMKKS